ncbi:MAG: MauE/DoxX family redox-associated membrane protein [Ornithinimicrobium sp.]|uniref:MauE/DoxX family redox-associated membrane protein n=1 Tax=Ornithinimicrobium sp. TaxID=1977084 RepID=UPI0026DF28CF|nr:MauE/DoxX family redox-associated membrane protein [Ornithinimicrobium sp.]MDO5738709.1 MauE/DoxX family redox-associated membrane protein [Ornithinimicrobium sp.]
MLARLILGGVLLVSGSLKLADLTGAIQSVVAYEIFDYEAARLVATMLPVVEVAVGVLLLVGLLTRASAVVAGLLMLAFIAGIISAWSRGLTIDCGCFSSGGPVDPGETTYLLDILRDLGLMMLAGWLVLRPRTPWSVDALLLKGR